MELTNFTLRLAILFIPGIISVLIENRNTNSQDTSKLMFVIRAFLYGILSYFILNILYRIINKLRWLTIYKFLVLGCVNPIHYLETGFLKYFHIISYKFITFTTIPHLNVKFFTSLHNVIIGNYNEQITSFNEILIVTFISVVLASLKCMYENIIFASKHLYFYTKDYKQNQSIFIKMVTLLVLKFNVILKKLQIKRDDVVNCDVFDFAFANLKRLIVLRDWETELTYIGFLGVCSKNYNNDHYKVELYLEQVKIINMNDKNDIKEADGVYWCKDESNSWDVEVFDIDI